MIPFVLLIGAALAWMARRSLALRTERAMLARLPLGPDGIIEGAAGLVRPASGRRAVLILHGFGDTPQTVRYLADHLSDLGFTVHAPLLPGHGRTLAEFGSSGARAWLEAAERELDALREAFEFVGLVGVSMGGALSVILAGQPGHRAVGAPSPVRTGRHGPDALVLLAPYLSMRSRALRLATLHWMISPFARYLPSREEASIRDSTERARNRGFGTVTPGLLAELRRVVQRAQQALPDVRQPALVIQSRSDNRIDSAAATRSFEMLGSAEKQFVWTDGAGHVITVDTGYERVLTLTGDWLLRWAEAATGHSKSQTGD